MDPFGIESYIQRRLNDFFAYEPEPPEAKPSETGSQVVTRPTTAPSLFRNFARTNLNAPRMDVIESPTNVSVKVELPGVCKEDIQVYIKDNVLSVDAERKEEKVKDTDRYYCSERSFGRVHRQIWLPAPVDENKVGTKFSDGILELNFAKKVQDEERKRIEL